MEDTTKSDLTQENSNTGRPGSENDGGARPVNSGSHSTPDEGGTLSVNPGTHPIPAGA